MIRDNFILRVLITLANALHKYVTSVSLSGYVFWESIFQYTTKVKARHEFWNYPHIECRVTQCDHPKSVWMKNRGKRKGRRKGSGFQWKIHLEEIGKERAASQIRILKESWKRRKENLVVSWKPTEELVSKCETDSVKFCRVESDNQKYITKSIFRRM